MDWLSIRNEYINTDISYRKLAKKYNVSFNTLKDRATKEHWKAEHDTQHHNTTIAIQQKTANVVVKKEIDRIERIINVSDKLLKKLEEATEQLDNYIVTNRVKVKTVEYDNEVKGKPAREVTRDTENIAVEKGVIDRQGLKQLASALKDIKDTQNIANSNESQLDKLDEVLGKIEGNI